ncbi:lipopolysaccharide kinase InaA family protein [Aquimarina spongiae]|uniref:Lipopolysaccharide kinase (Kdo/WaaP) family protein n=1 Tax=Aquimarina spongiae TaxID=570521 RepID=A0A1M6K289_9FLAO|nr:lipopolysaccharide kinase InaA family protein [Aquimarina spongiae]SHJ52972.1 Lipopolysaccharide kinase (Kdo/WaaP) family protein [Aquimarina spongiae]
MLSKFIIHPSYRSLESAVKGVILNFENYTEVLGAAERNVIKIVEIEDKKHTIKSFKIPNIFNQIAYRFLRKSKAERSYEYATKLLDLGINTPFPVAYEIQTTPLLFKRSYYISELVDCELTYRELTTDFDIENHEEILRAFTRFTYQLHVNGVNFLDHSPGNTLIKSNENGYDFFLVDLNRMEFGKMDFETRVKNFAKLTIHKFMVEIMSNEYAKCTGEDEKEIFDLMWESTREFQHRYYRKIRMKKRIFFWKKKYKTMVSDSPI